MSRRKKGESFIKFELDFLDEKLVELKNYIDSRPLDKLEDRIIEGRVVATIEKQREDIFKSIREYATIAEQVEKLREAVAEEEQQEYVSRGGRNMTFAERRFAKSKVDE